MDTHAESCCASLAEKIRELRGPLLVLGASGFVGANLLHTLAAYRDDVTGTASRLPAWRLVRFSDCIVQQVDVLDESQLETLLDVVEPQTVFDCVGYGGYPFETDAHRIYVTNFGFPTLLLPRLASRNIAAYVHAGSSSEYGTNSAGPDERGFTAPNSDYAVSKIGAASLIYFYGRHRRLRCANLRLYSVYGPFEEPSRLIPQVILHGLSGKLPEFVQPEISRDFVYVDDAVAAFVHAALLLDEPHWGKSFNIGTGVETTIADVARLARDLFRIDEVPTYTMPPRDWDVSHWFANLRSARSLLRWEPQVGLRQGLECTISWCQALADKDFYQQRSKGRISPAVAVAAQLASGRVVAET